MANSAAKKPYIVQGSFLACKETMAAHKAIRAMMASQRKYFGARFAHQFIPVPSLNMSDSSMSPLTGWQVTGELIKRSIRTRVLKYELFRSIVGRGACTEAASM